MRATLLCSALCMAVLVACPKNPGSGAEDAGTDEATRRRLTRAYYRIRGGLGYERTVGDYGASPSLTG